MSQTGMKCVYTHVNIAVVWHAKNLLQREGIQSQMFNEYLTGAAGELAPTGCWPEIWVDELDVERALHILKPCMGNEDDENLSNCRPWVCEVCSEELQPQFTACWRCEALRPNHS